MAHIETGNNYPGILSLMYYKSSSGEALSHLAETILRGPSPLTPGDRELIAAYVSYLNQCEFCHASHSAAAANHLGNESLVGEACQNPFTAPLSEKMRALLSIAASVQKGGKAVSPREIEHARKTGANDEEIHDTVLVAAAFCMYNRYVDGLGTKPARPEEYAPMGERLAKKGYAYPPAPIRWLVRRLLNRQFES